MIIERLWQMSGSLLDKNQSYNIDNFSFRFAVVHVLCNSGPYWWWFSEKYLCLFCCIGTAYSDDVLIFSFVYYLCAYTYSMVMDLSMMMFCFFYFCSPCIGTVWRWTLWFQHYIWVNWLWDLKRGSISTSTQEIRRMIDVSLHNKLITK